MLSWLFLLVAGLLEVVWAGALKRADEPLWLGVTAVALVASAGFLALAIREIPLGTAYAVWVGIGIVGTAVVSVVAYGDRPTPAQVFFLVLVAVGIVGTKWTAAASEPSPEDHGTDKQRP